MRSALGVLAAVGAVLTLLAAGCHHETRPEPEPLNPLTMLDVLGYPITALADEPVVLTSKVTWTNSRPVPLHTDGEADTLLALRFSISSAGVGAFMEPRFQDQGREDIFIVGSRITKAFDEDMVEGYCFDGEPLDRTREYYLWGRFAYRSHLSPPLDDPAFIEQSNNPVYWRQTFEFRLENLRPAEAS